ncbi:hypothetical protein [Almyronema epifaneia]|uniref:DUF4180 domain-containing protein n=1 Tax=Almyronema epifaneia S1 TaxID=2991925 RepID=A0ABW6IH04_9CYAN
MPYSVTYDSENCFILTTLWGAIDQSIVDDSRFDVARLAKQHNCFAVIADLREATSAVSTMEIYKLPQTTSAQISAAGMPIRRFKRALVVAQDLLDDPVFFETVSQNHGQNVRIFHTLEEAKKWLSVA